MKMALKSTILVWRKKGSTFFEYKQDCKDKLQTILMDLPDDYEYRFTVAAVCGNGTGRESPPSNAVMVERTLPVGWNRFFDDTKKDITMLICVAI